MPEGMQEMEIKAGPVGLRGVFKDLNTAATLLSLVCGVGLVVGGAMHYFDSQTGRAEMIGAIKEQTQAIKEGTAATAQATAAQQEANCLSAIKGTNVDPNLACRRTR